MGPVYVMAQITINATLLLLHFFNHGICHQFEFAAFKFFALYCYTSNNNGKKIFKLLNTHLVSGLGRIIV